MMRTIVRVDEDGCIVEPWEAGDAYVRCLTPRGWEWHLVEHAQPHARRARCLACDQRRRERQRATVRRMVRRATGCGNIETQRALADARHAEVERFTDELAAHVSQQSKLITIVDAVGAVLSDAGCECECECGYDDHDDECERCLGCRVEQAMRGETP